MTSDQWATCTDPHRMLDWLRGRASERRFRLYACGCVRRLWHLLDDGRARQVVEAVEDSVDGRASQRKVEAAVGRARELWREMRLGVTGCEEPDEPEQAAVLAATATADPRLRNAASEAAYWAEWATGEERRVQADLLRCVVRPFGPLRLSPGWLSPEVVSLAQAIYEQRSFDRLPELAGLLEAAGCRDAAVLEHLRGPGPHARGCHVVDAVLGKE